MPPNCKPPGEIFDTQEERQAVADWVEAIVAHDYCQHLQNQGLGGCELWFPSTGGKLDFFDVNVGKHRCENMADYLKFHNPHVNRQAIVDQCLASSPKLMDVKVPDIISHRFSRAEFYEIKPDSASGRAKGKDKIGWFKLLCKPEVANLPYRAGTTYKPNFVVDLPGGNSLGGGYKIVVQVFWETDGLILYRLCLVSTRPRQDEKCGALERAAALAAVVRIRLSADDTETVLEGLLPSAESPLQQAVGRASAAGTPAPNIRDDVRYVQLLLNDWIGRQAMALIAEDGLFGPQTDGAIVAFQQAVTGIPDGRIDVGGPAITELEHGHLRAAFTPGMLDGDQLPTLTLHGDTIYTDWDGEGNPDDLADEITWQMLLNAMEREIQGYFGLLYH